MKIATSIKAGARTAPSIPTLRKARRELNDAIADGGAAFLSELRDEVEDQLVEALNQARREREEAAK